MYLSEFDRLTSENRMKDVNDVFSVDNFDIRGDNMHGSDLMLSQSDISSINDSMAGTEGGTLSCYFDIHDETEIRYLLQDTMKTLANLKRIMNG